MPRRLRVVFHLMAGLGLTAGFAEARDLTFEERVSAQEAIERVYYAHQIGASLPFEQAVPRTVLEQKVRTCLLQSEALERRWATPITGAMLRAEVERMARSTRLPDRLQELFGALGGDPFLVGESLARCVLVDRLSRHFYAFDESGHQASREEAAGLRRALIEAALDPWQAHPRRTEILVVKGRAVEPGLDVDQAAMQKAQSKKDAALDHVLSPSSFDRWREELPAETMVAGPLRETADSFQIHVVLEDDGRRVRLAQYEVPKRNWEEWWAQESTKFSLASAAAVLEEVFSLPAVGSSGAVASCVPDDTWDNGALDDTPDHRRLHSAVWTGSQMIVWGGLRGGTSLNSGEQYDPATDTWSFLPNAGAPEPRWWPTAVWTGSQMIVWGGTTGSGTTYVNTGGKYDPLSRTWTSVSLTNAPTPRTYTRAVWTGQLMVVWGGYTGTYTDTGGRYDPVADTWTPTSMIGVPVPRFGHTTVWTGSQMLVWGGSGSQYLNSGGLYNPATDTWSATTTTGAPVARCWHAAVWTGSRMVVWGGQASTYYNSGGRYDPATNTWSATSTSGAPEARGYPTAIWTGNKMVVWGGKTTSPVNTGGRYDPVTDAWSATTATNAPEARHEHTAVWTGNLMIIWGGNRDRTLNSGGRYDPVTDTWTPVVATGPPEGRRSHSAVWTGNLMIVWGGENGATITYLSSGGRYDPALDTWSMTSLIGAPAGRRYHTAVWTGNLMVVWGGRPNTSSSLNTGGRYDPLSDSWAATATAGAPSARYDHTSIWTGDRMVVWGGYDGTTNFSNGYRYDPQSDTWAAVSNSGAPTARNRHGAVWTGSRMVVWGGRVGTGSGLNTGGRYDPLTDTWSATSTSGVPDGRMFHTTVWTGNRMIVWGGYTGTTALNTGGRYDPVSDTWTPVSITGAPTPRRLATAVWTGSRMVVWGGVDSAHASSGGVYDPGADSWLPTAALNAPEGRYEHTAVWTGSFMIPWGGIGASTMYFNNGGRYALGHNSDDDGDGYTECAGDCNDNNVAVNPGALEICDGRDNNCSGLPDDPPDQDHDGFHSCNGDCLEGNGAVYSNAPEVCDLADNQCPGDPGYGQVDEGFNDLDCDSHPDPGDCAPADAGAFALPEEVSGVAFDPDRVTLTWNSAVPAAGPGTVHDVARGLATEFPPGSGSAESCVGPGIPGSFVGDATAPGEGTAFWYLVRGRNVCGPGTYGFSSTGPERTTASCP